MFSVEKTTIFVHSSSNRNAFVFQPTVAQCGHVFCSHCITAWIRRSNHSCPCCRKRIVSSARVSSWDTFLSRAYNLLSEDTRQNRERFLRQRREEREAWETRQAASGAGIDRPMGPIIPPLQGKAHKVHGPLLQVLSFISI